MSVSAYTNADGQEELTKLMSNSIMPSARGKMSGRHQRGKEEDYRKCEKLTSVGYGFLKIITETNNTARLHAKT